MLLVVVAFKAAERALPEEEEDLPGKGTEEEEVDDDEEAEEAEEAEDSAPFAVVDEADCAKEGIVFMEVMDAPYK